MQVVPVYPLTHAHRSDEQTILISRSVHCKVEVHAIPTTPEMELYPFAMIIRCPHTVGGSEKKLAMASDVAKLSFINVSVEYVQMICKLAICNIW